jgi:hypothetical protein
MMNRGQDPCQTCDWLLMRGSSRACVFTARNLYR